MSTIELSAAQRACIDEVFEKLGEHFETFALVVEVDDEDGHTDAHLSYSGFFSALGLLTIAQHRLRSFTGEEDEAETDEEDDS
jgi:hypothetical protein